jgi:hypothetical protein
MLDGSTPSERDGTIQANMSDEDRRKAAADNAPLLAQEVPEGSLKLNEVAPAPDASSTGDADAPGTSPAAPAEVSEGIPVTYKPENDPNLRPIDYAPYSATVPTRKLDVGEQSVFKPVLGPASAEQPDTFQGGVRTDEAANIIKALGEKDKAGT